MIMVILFKRTAVPGKVPTAGSLLPGELGINLVDKTLFTADTEGNIIELYSNLTMSDIAGLVARLTYIEDAVSGLSDSKVDKIAGKSLSTNDFTTALLNKLNGIAAGATVNSSDSALINRSNHTGTQPISTITDQHKIVDFRYTNNAATGSINIDMTAYSIYAMLLTGNITLVPTNLPVLAANNIRSYVFRFYQGTTPYTISFWSGIVWLTPLPSPVANAIVECLLSYEDGLWVGRAIV